jgi:hypothetical protein
MSFRVTNRVLCVVDPSVFVSWLYDSSSSINILRINCAPSWLYLQEQSENLSTIFLNLLHCVFVLLTKRRIHVAVWIRIISVKSMRKWPRFTNDTVLHKTSYKIVLSQQRCTWTWVATHCNGVWCFCRTNTSRSLCWHIYSYECQNCKLWTNELKRLVKMESNICQPGIQNAVGLGIRQISDSTLDRKARCINWFFHNSIWSNATTVL